MSQEQAVAPTCDDCGAEVRPVVLDMIQHGSHPAFSRRKWTANIGLACECREEAPRATAELGSVRFNGTIPEEWQ